MAVFSAQDVVRFTPDSYKVDGEVPPGAPVYLLRGFDWKARAHFRARLASEGVRFPSDAEMIKAARQAIADVAPSNADELLAAVQAYEDMPERPSLIATDGETDEEKSAREAEMATRQQIAQAYEAIVDKLRQHPLVGNLIGLRTLYFEMAPPLAAAACLRGWENVSLTFERAGGLVPDNVLDQLTPADLIAVGTHAISLQAVSAAQRGN